MKIISIAAVAFLLSLSAQAKVVMEKVEYKQGDTALEGYIAYDTNFAKAGKKLPAVVIVHDWMGVGEYVKMRAEQVAGLGYVAFVADIYGKNSGPKDGKEAATLAGQYRNGDRKLLRARAESAFNEVKKNKFVDTNKVSAMGYCFGGTTVLEMARAGLPLKSVISFHGGLSTPTPTDAKNIKAPLLIMHGAVDPNVPAEEVAAFQKEMNDANVDYQFIAYSGAVHSFTDKRAGNDNSKGAAYNAKADERSFVEMKTFLADVNRK